MSKVEADALSAILANPSEVISHYDPATRQHGLLVLEQMENGSLRVWDDACVYRYESRETFDGDALRRWWMWSTPRGNIIPVRKNG